MKQLWDDVGDVPEKGTNKTTKQEKVQGTHDGVWEPVIALSNPVTAVIPTKSSWMTHQEIWMQRCSKQCYWELEKNCLETSEMGQQVTQLQTSLTPSVRWQRLSDSHKLLFNLHMHICLHTYTHR